MSESIRYFCKHTKTTGQRVIDLFDQYKTKTNSACTQGEFEDILFEENTRLIGVLIANCRKYFDIDGKDLGFDKFIKEQEPITRRLWDRIVALFPSKDGTETPIAFIQEAPPLPKNPSYMEVYRGRTEKILKALKNAPSSRTELLNNPAIGLSMDSLKVVLSRMVKENLIRREGRKYGIYKKPCFDERIIKLVKMATEKSAVTRSQIQKELGIESRGIMDHLISAAIKRGYITSAGKTLSTVYSITAEGKLIATLPETKPPEKKPEPSQVAPEKVNAVKVFADSVAHLKVLEIIRKKPGINKRELVHLSGLSIGTFNKSIVKLISSRLIEFKGTDDMRAWAQSFYPIPEESMQKPPTNPEPYQRLLPHGWDSMDLSKRIDFVMGVRHEGFKEYLLNLDPNMKKYMDKMKEKSPHHNPLNLYIVIFSVPADNYSEESKNFLKTFVNVLNQIGRGKLQYVETLIPHMIEVRELR